MRKEWIVCSRASSSAGPSPDSRASLVASARRCVVQTPRCCRSAEAPSGRAVVDQSRARARSVSETTSPLSSRSRSRSCTLPPRRAPPGPRPPRAAAAARASSSRPWVSLTVEGRRDVGPLATYDVRPRPGAAAVVGGVAVAHGVGRFIEAQKPSGEAADQHGQHEPRPPSPPGRARPGGRRRSSRRSSAGSPVVVRARPRRRRRRAGTTLRRPTPAQGALGGLRQHVEAPRPTPPRAHGCR